MSQPKFKNLLLIIIINQIMENQTRDCSSNQLVKMQKQEKETYSNQRGEKVRLLTFGKWNEKQEKSYINFLRKFYYIMRQSKLRYRHKIFNRMADEIGSRDSAQCKSHHQKMLLKYDDCLQNIIFATKCPNEPIIIGMGEFGENYEIAIREGVEKVEMSHNLPWFTVQIQNKLLVVIDEKTIPLF